MPTLERDGTGAATPIRRLYPSIARIGSPAHREAVDRVLGALYSYESALSQSSASVAVILLTTAIEALTVPNASWHRERVTTRFIRVVEDLCPAAIDEVMGHANFEQAFERSFSSRRRFLDLLYDMRSRPLHTGLIPSGFGGFSLVQEAHDPAFQVGLVSGLARAAIDAFLDAPRSSVIGHPNIDPGTGLDASSESSADAT